jgi:hypothetical protein
MPKRRVSEAKSPYLPVQQVEAQQESYLRHLSLDGTVTGGCKAAHISIHTVYTWREQDPSFVTREYEAREAFADVVEREMVRRGIHGVVKPVYQGGEQVGEVREYSDSLLAKLAGAARPNKFRERVDVSSSQSIVVRIVSARIDAHSLV